MKFFNTYKGLPKSVYVIFLAQVTNRFGDFVLPFLSLFLVKKLGLSFQSAGIAITLSSLSTIPGSFVCGKVADHLGRRKTYGVYQALAAMFIFLCVFTKNPWIIIGLICAASFFNGGIRPIISAILTDVLPAEKRQIGFSLSYLGINFGVALGPIVAGFLFTHYIPLMFIGDAITSWIAVILVVSNIPETKPDYNNVHNVREEEKSEEGNVLDVLLRRPRIIMFLIFNIFISMVYTQGGFSLPVMLTNQFGSNGPRYFGFIMSFNAVIVVVVTFLLTPLIKKWRPLNSITIGAVLYSVGFGSIIFLRSYPLYFVSTFTWTIGEILISTNFGTYIANNTPQNFRARFSAVTSLSWVIGAVSGTSLIGKYMDRFGVQAVWPLTFFLGLFGATGMYALSLKSKKSEIK